MVTLPWPLSVYKLGFFFFILNNFRGSVLWRTPRKTFWLFENPQLAWPWLPCRSHLCVAYCSPKESGKFSWKSEESMHVWIALMVWGAHLARAWHAGWGMPCRTQASLYKRPRLKLLLQSHVFNYINYKNTIFKFQYK